MAMTVRVASWNVLADSYARPATFPKAGKALEWATRQEQVFFVIRNLQADIICLQEVDHWPAYHEFLTELGYNLLHQPRPGGKQDACVIGWKGKAYQLVSQEYISYDDYIPSSLEEALQIRYKRHNVGIITVLQHLELGSPLIIANTHLHWNPAREELKLWQASIFLVRLERLAANLDSCTPVLVCGDMNCTPGSPTHQLLTTGYAQLSEPSPPQGLPATSSGARFICDASLNRMCRWLRILGIDCALETKEEEVARTMAKDLQIIGRARRECRSILTASKSLLQRRDCPDGVLVAPRDLESSLVTVCVAYQLKPHEDRFLTRCVKCNGVITAVTCADKKARLKAANQAPHDAVDADRVFGCGGCAQLYWWNDNKGSSAYRALQCAQRLSQQIQEAYHSREAANTARAACSHGSKTSDPNNLHLHLPHGAEGDIPSDEPQTGTQPARASLSGVSAQCHDTAQQAAAWQDLCRILSGQRISHGLRLKSAYSRYGPALVEGPWQTQPDELPCVEPFTNLTSSFVGTLDYILVDDRWEVVGLRKLPGLADCGEGLLPSAMWPSDHLALCATIQLKVDGLTQQRICRP